MFCEAFFAFVSFATMVALIRLYPCVRPHVVLQGTRRGARVVALVTLEGLFSQMLPHHVNFQLVVVMLENSHIVHL